MKNKKNTEKAVGNIEKAVNLTTVQRTEYTRLGLAMCGIPINNKTAELIWRLQVGMYEKGGDFSIADSVAIEVFVDKKYAEKSPSTKTVKAEPLSVSKSKTKEQEMEEFFLEKLNSCERITDEDFPDSIFFKIQNKVLFEQDNKNKCFWVRNDNVWSVFEDRLKLDYKDTQKFILGMVENHLKLDGFTTRMVLKKYQRWWKTI